MKYFLATILGAVTFFVVVAVVGAVWGAWDGGFVIAPCSSGASALSVTRPVTWEQRIGSAIAGAIILSVFCGPPAAAIGAFAGPIVVWFNSLLQDARRPPE